VIGRDITAGDAAAVHAAGEPVAAHTAVGRRERRLSLAGRRAFDLLGAGVLLILASPLLLGIAVAVWTTSRGPALFRQDRLGRGERTFRIYKFRTMRADNSDAIHREYVTNMLNGNATLQGEENAAYKLADDPRVTKVGGVLRKTSLDELPQLLNVVRGNMSLIGPRPVLPWEAELFDPRYHARFAVKPGMTGLWQVSGRSTLTMNEALELDVEYVERRTFRLDLSILFRTIPALLDGGGAR
jgi:lipopolysaccharide/colanic/teichoic acid biosynthesis glycosyltransferase